ncbi:hypothetical protein CAEBREN_24323 [Caenorhabditis brenneri]|uniref:Uncharacterized protein n=1 Tax=Caenorhabditis brenneri TaxID=135651 RepID=G0NXL3_CAEBE|nr:hypothetical protein CAEBREN_24323 [Caenorhabditis brenneri]
MASDTAIGQVWTPPPRRGNQPQGQRADGIKMLLDRCFTPSQNVSILQRSRLVDWRVPGSSSTGKHARKQYHLKTEHFDQGSQWSIDLDSIEDRRQSDKNDFAHTEHNDDSSGIHHQKTPTSGQQLPPEICSPGASLTREFFSHKCNTTFTSHPDGQQTQCKINGIQPGQLGDSERVAGLCRWLESESIIKQSGEPL